MKSEKILFVSDLDGTFLNENKQITMPNAEAVVRLYKEGGIFTIATGRSITGAKNVYKKIGFSAPAILYNGAMIYNYKKEEVLWSRCLPERFHAELKRIEKRFPALGIQIMVKEGIFSVHPSPVYRKFMQREQLPYNKVSTIDQVPGGWLKAEVTFEQEEKRFCEYIKLWRFQGVRAILSGRYTCEFVCEQVSKGEAIRELVKRMQSEESYSSGRKQKICCIGDHNNDIEMLKSADISFAMGNALEKVKEISDYVVADCNRDGVAEAIEKVLEKRIRGS